MLPEQDLFIEGLYREYAKRLFIYAFSRIQDRHRAQDIVQDTFHTAVRRIDTVMGHKNPGGWLMEVLKNKISENERANRRYLLRFISLEDSGALQTASSEQDPADLVKDEGLPVMERVEAVLTKDEVRFLKRIIFDKASHLDIAKEFGISVYASQKRLQRIREKLHKVFPGYKKQKNNF